MAKYSIHLGREYEMVKYIERLMDYFERDGLESESLNKEMVTKLVRMKRMITDKITNHIRVLGSILLSKPETEFFL